MKRTLNGESPFNEETLGEEMLYDDELEAMADGADADGKVTLTKATPSAH